LSLVDQGRRARIPRSGQDYLRVTGGTYVILAPDGTGEQPPAMGAR
jgi:hypothetical protein